MQNATKLDIFASKIPDIKKIMAKNQTIMQTSTKLDHCAPKIPESMKIMAKNQIISR